MSTGINIASSSGLTVGTTTVTSGTNGRVFFQAGGVLQQDANFTFDNTLKRLTLNAIGTAATDIPFVVRNSANTRNFLTVNGAGDVFSNGAQGVSGNAFFGENTGRSATGLYNCFFGLEAGRDNSTGANNSFFGVEAGRVNTTGGSNSFFGIQAGRSNTGSSNSFFGASAGYTNSTGTYNSCFGVSSGESNSTGAFNSCFGFQAGQYNSTGSENVFLGIESGRRILSGAFLTIANNSVFIGGLAKANANSETNQIVIGHSAVGLGSNTTVVGNSSTTLFRPYGNVAIGANSASARLDVRSQGALSTDIAFRVRNSADTKNLANITGLGDVYLGDGVTVTNQGSEPMIAIGKAITVNGIFNSSPIAIGHTTTSIGNSIAIGRGSSAGDSGINNSIAIGFNAVATGGSAAGSPAIAFGTNVTASSQNPGSIITGHSLSMGGATSANIVYGRYMNGAAFLGNAFAFGSGVSDASRASLDLGDSFSIYINQNTRALFLNQKSNLVFRNGQSLTSGTHFDANATNTFTIHNGTIPTTNIANAGQIYVESGTLRFRDSAGTITNVGGSVQSVASAATVTPVYTNKFVKITAQAVGLTLANPTGTWAEGQELIIRIKDSGSAQTIAYDTNYRAIGVTLPTTTTASKTTYLGIIYNSDDAKWDVIGVTTQA